MIPLHWKNMSFEWKNREEEGWKGCILMYTGRILISNRRQRGAAHKRTKQGQTVSKVTSARSFMYSTEDGCIYSLLPFSVLPLLADFSPHFSCHNRKLKLQMCSHPFPILSHVLFCSSSGSWERLPRPWGSGLAPLKGDWKSGWCMDFRNITNYSVHQRSFVWHIKE